MLKGPKKVIDQGVVRNVSLVEYHGKSLVVKTLLNMKKQTHYMKHIDMHHREVLTLDAVSDERVLLRHPSPVMFRRLLITSLYEQFIICTR